MIAYDGRIYRDKRIEPFDDPEWDKAEKADEESEYYWLDTCVYRYKDFLAICNQWLKESAAERRVYGCKGFACEGASVTAAVR